MDERAFKKCERAKGRSIPFAKLDGSVDHCLWMDDIKLILNNGEVICKDQDYADLSPYGRRITSKRYLRQMQDAVANADIKEIDTPFFFKKRIKGVCRFGDMLHENITEQDKITLLNELQHKSPKQVALEWDLSEWYCKNLYYKNRTK
jgi:hypothetical protein